jgi:hypothetical protein
MRGWNRFQGSGKRTLKKSRIREDTPKKARDQGGHPLKNQGSDNPQIRDQGRHPLKM